MDGSNEDVRGLGPAGLRRECEVSFCSKPVRSGKAALCEGHYNQKRKGKPFTELKPRRIEGGCGVAGCELPRRRGRYCPKHTARIARHGDPHKVIPHSERNFLTGEDHPKWTGDEATYNAVHMRLRTQRGSASEYRCISCPAVAEQWAYVHNRERSATAVEGPYSVVLADYEPMCVRCHKRMDMDIVLARRAATLQ